MKKLAVSVLLVASLYSCKDRPAEKVNSGGAQAGYFEYDGGSWSSMEYSIAEKTIDSCQYIIIFGSEGRDIIHKPNCRNPFHKPCKCK